MKNYQICTKCIMDTTVEDIVFDENGVCNYCAKAEKDIAQQAYQGEVSDRRIAEMLRTIKEEQKDKPYDCVMGVSGGVDSAYLIHKAHEWGLRILAVHVDAGWNTKTGEENIQKLCSKLNIDLKIVKIDWEVMREVQRAYMFSGIANIDVPQDHVFFTALYDFAREYGIKYVLTGSNMATECIMPAYLVYSAMDYTCLKDICKKHGRNVDLRKYPHMPYWKKRAYVRDLKILRPLNDMPYSKSEAMEILEREYGWVYYGAKHWESIFTKFLQSYYLPRKFGFNKSKAHLSNLIVNHEMTREEALAQLEKEKELYPEAEMLADRDYILEKLDISLEEWEKVMAAPNKTEDDYKNDKKRDRLFRAVKKLLGRV